MGRQGHGVFFFFGKLRRAPDQSCSYFTVANVHINNECAKRMSVCIARLLLIRDLCLKLRAVVLTGDFNKAVEREAPSGDGERRTSPLEAAFRGLLLVSLGCGVPAVSPTVIGGLVAAALSFFPNRSASGSFSAMVPSILFPRPSG